MTTSPDVTGGVVLLDVLAGEGDFDTSILERLGHPVVTCAGPVADLDGFAAQVEAADRASAPSRTRPM